MNDATISHNLTSTAQGASSRERNVRRVERIVYGGLSLSSAIRVVQDGANLAALFREVPVAISRVGGEVGLGASAVFATMQAGLATWKFIGSCKALHRSRNAAPVTSDAETARLSRNIDQWVTSGCPERDQKESYQDLLTSLDLENQALGAESREHDFRQTLIEFGRDGIFGGASAGVGFARLCQMLFGGVVNMAASGTVASALGIGGGALQFGAGWYARREARESLAASNAVRARIMADAEVLSAMDEKQSSPECFAAWLVYRGENGAGAAIGKGAGVRARAPDALTHQPKTRERRDADYQRYAGAVTGQEDDFYESVGLTRRALKLAAKNEAGSADTARKDIALAKKRMVYGVGIAFIGCAALLLSLSGVGFVAVLALSMGMTMVLRGMASLWTALTSWRIHRKLNPDSTQRDAAVSAASREVKTSESVDAMMARLRDYHHKERVRSALVADARADGAVGPDADAPPSFEAHKLGAKVLINTLRELGVSRTALRLFKVVSRNEDMLTRIGVEHQFDKMNRNLVAEADAMMRAQLRNVLAGDGARRAVGNKQVVDRRGALPEALWKTETTSGSACTLMMNGGMVTIGAGDPNEADSSESAE